VAAVRHLGVVREMVGPPTKAHSWCLSLVKISSSLAYNYYEIVHKVHNKKKMKKDKEKIKTQNKNI